MLSQRWLALGASTGGPAALHDLLATLSPHLPVKILIVQHIRSGFDAGLTDWLADSLQRDVRVARDGETPPPGSVRTAPAGLHLRVSATDSLELDAMGQPRAGHRPSVDELFCSLARHAPERTAAVLLTGMGTDGAEGLLALRRSGAFCLAQDEASSAVFGMPRAARELHASELDLSPAAIGAELCRWLALPLNGGAQTSAAQARGH